MVRLEEDIVTLDWLRELIYLSAPRVASAARNVWGG
jgi:hypothetical protein